MYTNTVPRMPSKKNWRCAIKIGPPTLSNGNTYPCYHTYLSDSTEIFVTQIPF